MPISYYAGLPRHGKSYSVIKRVIHPALSAGRKVVTNIPLLEPAYALPGSIVEIKRGLTTMMDIANMLLGDKSAETGDYVPNPDYAGAVFVLDEFMMLLPSGVKTATIDEKIKAFFAMHGHVNGEINGKRYVTEIIIISQNPGQIASMVRDMIDQSFVIEKTMVGKKKLWNAKIYSKVPPKGTFLRSEQGTYDPEMFQYYKTQTLSEDQGDETKTDDSTNLMNLKAFKFLIPATVILLPVLIWLAISSFSALFGGNKPEPAAVAAPVVPGQAPSVPGASVQVASVPAVPPKPPSILEGVTVYTSGSYTESGRVTRYYKLVPESGEPLTLTESDMRSLGLKLLHMGNSVVLSDGTYRKMLFPWNPPVEEEKETINFEPMAQGAKSVF